MCVTYLFPGRVRVGIPTRTVCVRDATHTRTHRKAVHLNYSTNYSRDRQIIGHGATILVAYFQPPLMHVSYVFLAYVALRCFKGGLGGACFLFFVSPLPPTNLRGPGPPLTETSNCVAPDG